MFYILTASGKRFRYDKLDPASVDIEDIAHALGHINRFGGHAKFASSVARHSVAVSLYLQHRGEPTEIVLAGLLHDAHEAYFGDIPSPLKAFLGIGAREKRIQKFVLKTLGIDPALVFDERVKLADLVSLKVERDTLLPADGDELGWKFLDFVTPDLAEGMPVPFVIHPETARDHFLERYYELTNKLEWERRKAA